jgi:uncharacterized protein with PIN domain
MPITITIDHQNDKLVLELEALDDPDPRALHIAIALMEELNERLHHDRETCPDCQAKLAQIEAEEQGHVH